MSTVRVYLSGNPVHDRVLQSFYDGCPEEKELVANFEWKPSDIAVVFGVYKSKVPISFPRGRVFSQQRSLKKDVVVLETGYINRGDGINHHYAAGFNGLNGRADFRNKQMPADRKGKLGIKLKPWRKDGDSIILCGQVPWDASVDHINFNSWMIEANKLLQEFGKRVIVRHHPQIRDPGISLDRQLEKAWAVVTFNSNAGVEAAISGVPVFADDQGSMAWEIANKSLEDMGDPKTPERDQWLSDLAYAQWTQREMACGETWKHLFR